MKFHRLKQIVELFVLNFKIVANPWLDRWTLFHVPQPYLIQLQENH